MRKILFAAAFAALAISLTGCYEKFDAPEPWSRYNDADLTKEGYEIVSIEELKKLFYNPANQVEYLNDIQKPKPGGDPKNSDFFSFYYPITEKLVIKGKVISNDASGNFYRGLFIQDKTGGIEVKVGENAMYTKFTPGTTVYIICDGLVLGNYRSMLSLGLKPMTEDMSDNGTPYPNRFMEVPTIIDHHVKLGETGAITEDDIITVGATQALTADDLYKMCGKLVRFEELTSVWVPYADSYNAGYPEVFYKFAFNTYATFNFADLITEWKNYREVLEPQYKIDLQKYKEDLQKYQEDTTGTVPEPVKPVRPIPPTYAHTNGKKYVKPEPENLYLKPTDPAFGVPSWGFKHHDSENIENVEDEVTSAQDNYASAKFENSKFNLGQDSHRAETDLLVRTSGFSRLALKPVLAHGKKAAVTGIVQRYTDGRGNNIAFQIAVNNINNIVEVQ